MGLCERVIGWGWSGLFPEDRLLTFVPASARSPLGYPVENILGGQRGAKPPCSCKTYAPQRGAFR